MATYKKLLINALSGEVEKRIKEMPRLYGFEHSKLSVKGDDVEILKKQEYDTVILDCTVFVLGKDENDKPTCDLVHKKFRVLIIGSYVYVDYKVIED